MNSLPTTITFDLTRVPFTRPGSYLRVRRMKEGHLQIGCCRTLLQQQAHDGRWNHDFYDLTLVRDEQRIPFNAVGSPERLEITAEDGSAHGVLVFCDNDTIRVSVTGASIRLTAGHSLGGIRPAGPLAIFVNDAAAMHMHRLRVMDGCRIVLAGTPDSTAVITLSGKDRIEADLQIRRDDRPFCSPAWHPTECLLAERHVQAAAWLAKRPAAPEQYATTATSAWMRLPDLMVAPEGPLTRPTILMSKMSMERVWSWDNCFNALALADADAELAFDQLRVFHDNQSPTGAYPDVIGNLAATFGHAKPAIWGWTLMRLVDQLGFDRCADFLRESYGPLEAQTRYWLEERINAQGIPVYDDGCDSGWDNSTAFDDAQGRPNRGGQVATADLCAHLVLQCEALAFIAGKNGRPADAARWRAQAVEQLNALLTRNIRDGRIVSWKCGGQEQSTSLLNHIAMVLGNRLPTPIFTQMAAELSPAGPFLTEWGWASETITSPHYQRDGYWRGPIWASPAMLLAHGLSRCGYHALAKDAAERFLRMAGRDNIFWENYDAQTGEGLRCSDYAWSAVATVLFAQYLASGREVF